MALCIAHAALAKEPWLLERNIQADWPVYGLCSHLHLDNAREFRCEALRRGCEQYGIGIVRWGLPGRISSGDPISFIDSTFIAQYLLG